MIRKCCQAAVMGCLCGLLAAPGMAQFVGLTSRIPNGANTIILIDIKQIHHSPFGKAQNLAARHQADFEAGLIMVPPDADKYVGVAKLDFIQADGDEAIARMLDTCGYIGVLVDPLEQIATEQRALVIHVFRMYEFAVVHGLPARCLYCLMLTCLVPE